MVEVGVISIFCHVPHLVSGWIQVAAANSCTPMCPPSCNYFLISVASQQIKLYISETYSRNGRGHVISVVLLAVVRSSVLMSGVAVICVCISCHAVTDVLRGRPLDDIVDDLPVVWETCFRVRDDIKVCLSPASVCLSVKDSECSDDTLKSFVCHVSWCVIVSAIGHCDHSDQMSCNRQTMDGRTDGARYRMIVIEWTDCWCLGVSEDSSWDDIEDTQSSTSVTFVTHLLLSVTRLDHVVTFPLSVLLWCSDRRHRLVDDWREISV